MVRRIIGGGGALLALGAAVGLALGFVGPLMHNFDAFAHLRAQFALLLLVAALTMVVGGLRNAALGALAAGAFGLAMLGPVWRAPSKLPESCAHTTLTVVTANVHYANKEAPAAIRALLATKADVIAVQELSDSFWKAAAPLLAAYPHFALEAAPKDFPRGAGLFAKKPIRVIAAIWGKEPVLDRALAAVTVAGREIGVASFHFDRAWVDPKDAQRVQVEGFRGFLKGMPVERILLGDFNAAPWSHVAAEIERKAGVRIVGGLRRTWRGVYPNPILGPDVPALIGAQIDHVFLSPGLGVRRIETFDLPGSVHWGVRAVIQVPSRAAGCA
ncbi:MAG: endonuclease/exonuclease/phosphatase family protein [Neomegalonema sp.]|nr:endonuclease/exonuclease/phosphatase family protein [Neomegalonema sp.]